jgi:hypothetical protein
MNGEQRRVVLDALTNAEEATDRELVQYFIQEVRLTPEEARYWVSRRTEFLGRI